MTRGRRLVLLVLAVVVGGAAYFFIAAEGPVATGPPSDLRSGSEQEGTPPVLTGRSGASPGSTPLPPPEDTPAPSTAAPHDAEESDDVLLAHVEDPGGRPVAGVRVGIEARRAPGAESHDVFSSRWSGSSSWWAVTDETGEARIPLPNLDRLRQAIRSAGVQGEWRVRAEVAARDDVHVLLRDLPSHGQTVRLQLPASARVLVRLLDAHGAPELADAKVVAGWRTVGSERGAPFHRTGDVQSFVDGVATYEDVGLGLEFHFTAHRSDGASELAQVVVPGPVNAGETVEVELRLGPPRPYLQGTVLDATGEAAGEAFLVLETWRVGLPPPWPHAGPHRPSRVYLKSDAEGRFAVHYGLLERCEYERYAILKTRPQRSGVPVLHARIEVPHEIPLRWNLPPLRLVRLPILASGTVTDASGRPLSRARVTVSHSVGDEEHRPRWTLPAECKEADAEGRFEIRHAGEFEQLAVHARKSGCRSVRIDGVTRGATDLRIVLEPDD